MSDRQASLSGTGSTKSKDEAANEIVRACRKLLYMVAELHRRGYESLRIMPCFSPSGAYWRCEVKPAVYLVKRPEKQPPPATPMMAQYSSGSKAEYYQWGDCTDWPAEQMADRFEQTYPDLLAASKCPDPDYVRWFADMLVQTEPGGFPYLFDDYTVDRSVMHVTGDCPVRSLPLPPEEKAGRVRPIARESRGRGRR